MSTRGVPTAARLGQANDREMNDVEVGRYAYRCVREFRMRESHGVVLVLCGHVRSPHLCEYKRAHGA